MFLQLIIFEILNIQKIIILQARKDLKSQNNLNNSNNNNYNNNNNNSNQNNCQ